MYSYTQINTAFEVQSQALLEAWQGLNTIEANQGWYAPSRLPGWDIFTLSAHLLRLPLNILQYCNRRVDGPPQIDHITYFTFDGKAEAEGVTERTRQTATTTSPARIVEDYASALQQAQTALADTLPHTVIKTIFGSIRLDEYMITRVFELVVHTLDLTAPGSPVRAIPLDPVAQNLTVETLEGLLRLQQPGWTRPTALHDDRAFIEAATGRVPYPGLNIPAFS